MRYVATKAGTGLPATDTLKVMVSRWENGAAGIGDFYARILHGVFTDSAPVAWPTRTAPAQTVASTSAATMIADIPVTQWTGRQAHGLRQALRLTHESFAQVLGVAVRTVAKWSAEPDVVPVTELQRALDTLLSRSTSEQRSRFTQLTQMTPAQLAAVA